VGPATPALAYAASYLPPLYTQTSYWTSSPTFFFVRLGILTTLVPVAYSWSWMMVGRWHLSPIREFGVASLFVYWIHVEMVYGVLSTPIHRALTFEQALAAMAAFCLFLYSLVRLKQRWSAPGLGEKSTPLGSFRATAASNRPLSG
jgi:hypothetical protein